MQKLSEEAKKTHRKVNWKTVDYIDLCRYDKGFECAVEVKVKKDGFPLGKKGDILRFCVSEYGIQRLLWDSLNGVVDITANSLVVSAFEYPDVSRLEERTEELRELLIETIRNNDPLPQVFRDMLDE
ncbi:MAG: hypothetical protein Q4E53_13460 [Eubacteriales bacterium]|nr:hypothetical protein [Eubacteriales bacterium]